MVDAQRVQERIATGRAHVRDGQLEDAEAAYREALRLTRGDESELEVKGCTNLGAL